MNHLYSLFSSETRLCSFKFDLFDLKFKKTKDLKPFCGRQQLKKVNYASSSCISLFM
jgi:hypothetical protein